MIQLSIQSCRGKLLVLVALLSIMVVVNSVLIFRVIRSNRQVSATTYPVVALSNEMELATTQVQQYLSDISATRAQDGKDDGFKNAEENAIHFKENIKTFALLRPDKATFLQEYDKAFDAYYLLGKKMAQAYISYGPSEGNKLMPQFDEQADKLAKYTDEMREESEREMALSLDKVNSEITIVFSIMIISGLFTIILSLSIARLIANSLKTITKSIQKDDNGYITIQEIKMDSKDEFSQLAGVLNALLSQVQGFVKQVSVSATQLTLSSEELNASAEQSAQATNQVAASIAEVSSGTEQEVHAVNEVSITIGKILGSIQQAATNSHIVMGTSEAAANAAKVGSRSVDTVHRNWSNRGCYFSDCWSNESFGFKCCYRSRPRW